MSSALKTIVSEGIRLPEGELDKIFAHMKETAEAILANPEKFGISQPVGQDDVDEENSNFINELCSYLVGELKSDMLELSYGKLDITYDESVSDLNEAKDSSGSFTHYIELGDDELEVEVEYTISDGSFDTGLDYPKTHSYGPEIEMTITNKATGAEIDYDTLNSKTQDSLQQACIDDASENSGPDPDAWRDERMDRDMDRYDESLGGDLGINLIDEVKEDPDRDIYDMGDSELVDAYTSAWKNRGTLQALDRMDKIKDEMTRRGLNIKDHVAESVDEVEEIDETFRADLEKLIKNARFRM